MQSRTPARSPARLVRAVLPAAVLLAAVLAGAGADATGAAGATETADATGAAGAVGAEAAGAARTALAADSADMPSPGALRAATCVTCHGAAQPVPGSQIPRLAGMPADRIEQAMRDYAARAEAGDLMGQIARGYDAPTVALIARWYAGLAPEAP